MLKTLKFCRFGAFVHGALVRAPRYIYIYINVKAIFAPSFPKRIFSLMLKIYYTGFRIHEKKIYIQYAGLVIGTFIYRRTCLRDFSVFDKMLVDLKLQTCFGLPETCY